MKVLSGYVGKRYITHGYVDILGEYDLDSMKEMRESGILGFCPQHNVLFNSLTVEEHIKLFLKLKRISKAQLRRNPLVVN